MQVLTLGPDFALTVKNPTGAHKHLHSTAAKYSSSIVGARGAGCNASLAAAPQAAALSSCVVTVEDTTIPLGKGVDESYDLRIEASGTCVIQAHTVWGAFHGMESLAQLAAENCTISNAPITIRDSPRFDFRGDFTLKIMGSTLAVLHYVPKWLILVLKMMFLKA